MDQVDRILEQWRQQRPELDVAPMGTIGRMKRLGMHLSQSMEQVFGDYGLNNASFDVLATLRRAGAPFALSPSQLIDWTMVTSGTMTHRIDRLEARGLVTRERAVHDGRASVVRLTEAGFGLIDTVVSAHVANQHQALAALDDEERAELDRLLRKWLGGFEHGD
ncbi:transcriptional regulator [Salinisphaera sp. T5B8]|uniref:MarR family winged helix-turn-helix transcriptional regulator n=1 Tax=Salinisphaera sp. T5B8 TaxID=1304154 RepID=UPI003341E90B